ncbi:MAG: hypothetical protein JNG88_17980, partial [Phycisphaerales bacterium]|nr:hypothetical protein [Phycisphaerales bacterium]
VREALISLNGVERLIASGECHGVGLAAVSRAVGWGQMTGSAHVAIDDLTIEANRIRSFEATALVDGPEHDGQWVSGE